MTKLSAFACIGALCSFGFLTASAAEGVVTADRLNIRLKPDLKAPVVVKLDRGTKVDVRGESGEFVEIAAPARTPVYISAVYLNGNQDKTTAPMKMRVTGDDQAASYGMLPKGSAVKVLEIDQHNWAKIEPPANLKLYAAKRYVQYTPATGAEDKPADLPDDTSVAKPEVQPADKPADLPKDKPEVKPADKPEVKPTDKPELQPVDKPADLPKDKPEAKPADKPEAKPVDKPETKPEAKPADKPEAKPVDKPETKPADKPEAKPVDKPETKPETKPADKPESKPADLPADKSADLPDAQPAAGNGKMSAATEAALRELRVTPQKNSIQEKGTLLKIENTTVPLLQYALMKRDIPLYYVCSDQVNLADLGDRELTFRGRSFKVPGWKVPILYIESVSPVQ